jgi:FkbM family methyltransferase
MLIKLDFLISKYNVEIKGILHIGAHECEEITDYEKYTQRDKILWVEAISEKVKFNKEKYDKILIENAVVSDNIQKIKFNISNNGQSSSMLELGTHQIHHPHIYYTNFFECETIPTIEIVKKHNIPFNFINLDIQGSELKALKGLGEYLHNVDYIYTEVNKEELYKGCCLLEELDEYLNKYSFIRVELSMTEYKWGDAFYIKKNKCCFISVDMCGGLGNQLFQIACVYALCYKYNAIPIIKKIESSPSIFKNRQTYFNNLFRKLKIYDEKYYDNIPFFNINEKNAGYSEINILNLLISYKLKGYFQSEKYFNNYKNEIIELLDLGNEHEKKIKDEYEKIKNINKETVSLHVRRGDYLQLSYFHTNIQNDYYSRALTYFPDDILIVIFSDDINWCKSNLHYKNIHYVENIIIDDLPSDVIEMKLMSLCDNNIIANSTFSWWGAWLNKNEKKKIIAPSRWFEDPVKNNEIKDIYCDNWIIV